MAEDLSAGSTTQAGPVASEPAPVESREQAVAAADAAAAVVWQAQDALNAAQQNLDSADDANRPAAQEAAALAQIAFDQAKFAEQDAQQVVTQFPAPEVTAQTGLTEQAVTTEEDGEAGIETSEEQAGDSTPTASEGTTIDEAQVEVPWIDTAEKLTAGNIADVDVNSGTFEADAGATTLDAAQV